MEKQLQGVFVKLTLLDTGQVINLPTAYGSVVVTQHAKNTKAGVIPTDFSVASGKITAKHGLTDGTYKALINITTLDTTDQHVITISGDDISF